MLVRMAPAPPRSDPGASWGVDPSRAVCIHPHHCLHPRGSEQTSDNCSSSEFSPDCCWTLVLINSTGSRNHSLFLPPNNRAFPSPALPGHQGQKPPVHADCRLVLSSPIRLLVLLTEHLPSHPSPSVPTLLKPCGYCPLLPACHSHFLIGLLPTSFQPLHTTTEEHAKQSLVLPP